MEWLHRLFDFIAPRQCVVCGNRLAPNEHTLCASCLLYLPRTGYQFTPDDNPMVQTFWHLTPIRRAAALFFFEPHSETARLVYSMKYGQRPDIGEDMGRVMANDMQQAHFFDGIDLLLPVPLSRKRLRQRGYNQSEQLAVGISDVTGLPVAKGVLRRLHFRQSQTSLSRHERQENVEGMFRLVDEAPLRGRHVLLIDDICTTGATLIACADALRNIEDIRISVLTLGFTKS
ncbi:MAG: ComF family protein [Prevotella sp.]|nr:ComF family protein [Prevotella sp.]